MKKISKLALISIILLFNIISINIVSQAKETEKISSTNITKITAGCRCLNVKYDAICHTGFQIQYSTNKNFLLNATKTKNVTVEQSEKMEYSTTIENLKPNKKYYVRIRTYKIENEKKYYSSWSEKKTIKTLNKPKKIDNATTSILAHKKAIVVTWSTDMLSTGYQIQYSTNSKFNSNKTKTITINKNTIGWKKITGLKANKKYYVRIRTYKKINGKKYYSEWKKRGFAKTLSKNGYWCYEGGKQHFDGDGENEHGYYKSWDEAWKACKEYMKDMESGNYKVDQCWCGLYFFWVKEKNKNKCKYRKSLKALFIMEKKGDRMKKIKDYFKKLMVIFTTIILLFVNLPLSVFAAYITEMNSNAEFGIISGSKSDYGHELHYAKYDGTTYIVFCCQYSRNSPDGSKYKFDEDFQVQLKEEKKSYKKVAEYIYFGYVMQYGTGLPTTTAAKKAACATQQYVWEYIKNNINDEYGSPSRSSWNSTYMSSSIYSDWLEKTKGYYEQYHDKSVSFDGKTKSINLGETKTYTDTNDVLSCYSSFDKVIDGVRFKHSKGSNDLIVTVESSSSATKVQFKSNKLGIYETTPNGDEFDTKKMSTYMYFHFTGAIQNLMFSNYIDPEFFSLTIGVESGEIELTKTDNNNTPLAGCTFKLYEDEDCTERVATGKTDASGKILFDSLSTGTFWVKETRSS